MMRPGVGVLLEWQVYGTDFGPLFTRRKRNFKTGTVRELRKEKKNREDGLLPWGLQARDGGAKPRRTAALSRRLIRGLGPCTWSFSRSATSAAGPPPNSSLWPTLFVLEPSLSPTLSSLIASSSTPSLRRLQYLPPSSMHSKIRVTFTPWPSTSQRAARAFWSHPLVSRLSTGNLNRLPSSDPRQL